MNNLVKTIVKLIQEKLLDGISNGSEGQLRESRFIFHGPPLPLIDEVFNQFLKDGGVSLDTEINKSNRKIPVLLQLPENLVTEGNPEIGLSGKCTHHHLLDVRNDPNNNSSFLALIPPGQHNNMSVASTTEEFGVARSANTLHATIEEWWDDEFIHKLILIGLTNAGFSETNLDDAIAIVHSSVQSIDDIDQGDGDRKAAWALVSRIFSIPSVLDGISNINALSLACGVPSKSDNQISSKIQLGMLSQISNELSDGFRTGIERVQLSPAAIDSEIQEALQDFLKHIQEVCNIPTAFERSTEAFYLANDDFFISLPAPKWWTTLTTEVWEEILSEGSQEVNSDLSIECTNSLITFPKGLPIVVSDEVKLKVLSQGLDDQAITGEVTVYGGGFKPSRSFPRKKIISIKDTPPLHKTPISYKCSAEGSKSASLKVISLRSWSTGIFVTSRLASKVSSPKKPRKSKSNVPWESNLSMPGSGRYELLIFLSPDITIDYAIGLLDDANELEDSGKVNLHVHPINQYYSQIEIEIDGKFQLDIGYSKKGADKESYTVYVTCEEIKEEGCRSEFERLIKLNRKHLEKFDSKTVVQLDRHARISSLQMWMLDSEHVRSSYKPIALSDDYVNKWAPPDWNHKYGPILSDANFLHDPRPDFSDITPPDGFLDIREKLAALIRETNDNSGLIESAPLGKWLSTDQNFKALVEKYLSIYSSWLNSDREIACWIDVSIVCSRSTDGKTLERIPDALIISPLHPLRFAWHCLAQEVLFKEVEGMNPLPCPASCIFDPDSVPDFLELSLQSPNGNLGIEKHTFISIECNSDYWSVLWNGKRLKSLTEKTNMSPFDKGMGITLGGIASGFSPAQVSRALEDVSEILSAKPIISITVSSAGGASDACNDGLTTWCTNNFGGFKFQVQHWVD